MQKARFLPYGFALPLAAMAAALGGAESAAVKLMAAMLAMDVAALGAPDAFRRAAAGMVSRRKVAGCALLALLMAAVAAGAGQLCAPWIAGRSVVEIAEARWWLGAAAALVALRCAEEIFVTQGDMVSARLSDLLGGVVTAAALLIFYDDASRARACCLSACGMLTLSLGIAAFFGHGEKPQLSPAIFREAPAAWLRALLYPALACGMVAAGGRFSVAGLLGGAAAALVCRTTFRRSAAESAGFNVTVASLALLLGGLLASAELFGFPTIGTDSGAFVWLGLLCGLSLYGGLNAHTCAAMLLMLAAAAGSAADGWAPETYAVPLRGAMLAAGGLAAFCCMIPDLALLIRRGRANRIRRGAQKRT